MTRTPFLTVAYEWPTDPRTPGPNWCRIHGTSRCAATCRGRRPADPKETRP